MRTSLNEAAAAASDRKGGVDRRQRRGLTTSRLWRRKTGGFTGSGGQMAAAPSSDPAQLRDIARVPTNKNPAGSAGFRDAWICPKRQALSE